MIDLKNIETFVWVAQLGGFGLAAQRLHTTQPGISQRIAAIENDLGVKLFDREPRRVVLTAKGRELLPYAEKMLRLRAEIFKVAGSTDAFRGHVRLGVSETIVHTRLTQLVEKVHATYPSITIEIDVDVSQNLRRDLLGGNIDIAFLLGPVIKANVRNLDFASYRMAWVASPKLSLPKGKISLAEIVRFPIITFFRSSKPYMAIHDLLLCADLSDFKMYGVASLSTIVKLCIEGMGVCAIPIEVIKRELKSRQLRLLDVAGGELEELNFTISYLQTADANLLEAIANLAMSL